MNNMNNMNNNDKNKDKTKYLGKIQDYSLTLYILEMNKDIYLCEQDDVWVPNHEEEENQKPYLDALKNGDEVDMSGFYAVLNPISFKKIVEIINKGAI